MTLHLDDDLNESATSGEKEEVPEPDLLDLYLCCQCSVYCLVSQVIPGVVPIRVLDDFVKDKLDHPQPGRTPEVAVVTGLETIITYVLASISCVSFRSILNENIFCVCVQHSPQ
jgi:ubiquitin carboxyl-terminal hydrolase 25